MSITGEALPNANPLSQNSPAAIERLASFSVEREIFDKHSQTLFQSKDGHTWIHQRAIGNLEEERGFRITAAIMNHASEFGYGPRVQGFFMTQGEQGYMVTEAYQGRIVGQSFSLEDWQEIAACVTRMHESNIWHTCLWPENVVWTMEGAKKVFGVIEFDSAWPFLTPGHVSLPNELRFWDIHALFIGCSTDTILRQNLEDLGLAELSSFVKLFGIGTNPKVEHEWTKSLDELANSDHLDACGIYMYASDCLHFATIKHVGVDQFVQRMLRLKWADSICIPKVKARLTSVQNMDVIYLGR
jgi:hypothetical protein